MRILVTGSSGHLGEALVRTLRAAGHTPFGLDVNPSPFTDCVGSITDPETVARCIASTEAVIHTATLHKPHIGTHSRSDFIDINVSGTLNLLEAAIEANCSAFIYTSTTSVFGAAMRPPHGGPTTWVTEALRPQPKNIYGASKSAAEDLCEIFHRNTGLPAVVLRTSRFFLEADDDSDKRASFVDQNLKANELLFRRADIEDIVQAHLLALSNAAEIGFDKLIVSATTPFREADCKDLSTDAATVLKRYLPSYEKQYSKRGWSMLPTIDRVYDNTRARDVLGWLPKYDFEFVIDCLARGEDFRSPLALLVGTKGYHDRTFDEGPYPVTRF